MRRLAHVKKEKRTSKNLHVVNCDLDAGSLPFVEEAFDALLIVHFVPANWEKILVLLRPGGLLFIETMGGQGGNYRGLPRAGELERVLSKKFDSEQYLERRVGPPYSDAMVVKLVALKR